MMLPEVKKSQKGAAMARTIQQNLVYLEYENRENDYQHIAYTEQLCPYELLKNADPSCVKIARETFASDKSGILSRDCIRNLKYLFVGAANLACRFSIEGGLSEERAFNISDLFIQRMDQLNTEPDIRELHEEMFEFYLEQLVQLQKKQIFSKPVMLVKKYIQVHLHEKILSRQLSQLTGLNYSYLSTLFRKETGIPITEYISQTKAETAANMLRFSDYSLSQISETLNYSSYSHFARCFRKYYSISPKEYQNSHYNASSLTESHIQENFPSSIQLPE